jgi:hypothetical protein
VAYRKTRTGSERAASRRPVVASRVTKDACAGAEWARPLVAFTQWASEARGHDPVRGRCSWTPVSTATQPPRRTARRPLAAVGKASTTRRDIAIPTAFAYVAKRSAEKRADASAGDAACAQGSASRQPSHVQGERMARVQAGGQCLLPTPGQ